MSYIKNPVQAISYLKFRPSPPNDLVETVVSFLKEMLQNPLGLAIDIGCGSGQSTQILAPYFQRVVGIDSSKEQLLHAQEENKCKNISYRLGSAEKLEEKQGSVDLVTVGMAVHWFNLQQFSAEVNRVLRPGGALAIYGYGLPQPWANNISMADTLHSMIESALGEYFPEESKRVYFDNYKGQQFSKLPFFKQPAHRFEFLSKKTDASIEDVVGYVSTTSAFQNYKMKHGEEKGDELLSYMRTKLAEQLGRKEVNIDIKFPYFLLLSRKDP